MTDAIEAGLRAFKACRPVERVACQDFGMQQDDIIRQQLEAAFEAAIASGALVPASAVAEMRIKPDRLAIARAICRSDDGPGVPSCVMDDHPERDPCNETNCRRFEQADEVIKALGQVVPASAVAEMRERCAETALTQAKQGATAEQISDKIRQLEETGRE